MKLIILVAASLAFCSCDQNETLQTEIDKEIKLKETQIHFSQSDIAKVQIVEKDGIKLAIAVRASGGISICQVIEEKPLQVEKE